ncbi:MAG: glycine cleavage system protein H [Euryarchaeota archaeon]|nr:glycine cleavage system protein H [Euryarchaeota archaeon]
MAKIGDYDFPDDLYYSPEHTWAKIEPDGNIRVGATDFAQKMAGKIVVARPLAVGKTVPTRLKPFCTIESGKWVGKLLSPVAGTIVTINTKVRTQGSLVNKDPYGEGWLVIIKPSNLDEDLPKIMKTNDPQFEEYMKKKIADIEAKAKAKLPT